MLDETKLGLSVSDYVDEHDEVVNEILSSPRPHFELGEDYPCWSYSSTSEFSTKSAYDRISGFSIGPNTLKWDLVWKWEGPHRVIWQVLRGGAWKGDFARNMGTGSVLGMELCGIYSTLLIAWDKGFQKLWIESDSSTIVHLIQHGHPPSHPYAALLNAITQYRNRQ
ncbi:Reverse transcriptase-like [Sesbania bispinosa]|nr:Reverse transcriptase-like [Sesbania bispinosa]